MNTSSTRPIIIATRGSALALAQAHWVLGQCKTAFPAQAFEISIIKTTGDKLQTASLAQPDKSLPKGLFTKELEVALLEGRADLAVHSLKDLPTELPAGLKLGAAGHREDVRDVLIYRAEGVSDKRGFPPQSTLKDLPKGVTVATSSPRRKAQLLLHRPDLNVVELRGNVPTRLQKLAENPELDAIVLAAAGLSRLHFEISADGHMHGGGVPERLLAVKLETSVVLPCVGQGAIGIEIRENDERLEGICARLNHEPTWHSVVAERAFLRAMGGGCQAPVGAHAEVLGGALHLRAISFLGDRVRRAEASRPATEAVQLGQQIAAELKN